MTRVCNSRISLRPYKRWHGRARFAALAHPRSLILLLVLLVMGAAAAQNVVGTVACDGIGLGGVPVSDGVNIVVTDADGRYALNSDKHEQVVFVVTPAGYEPTFDEGFIPRFWGRLLTSDTTVVERVDFELHQVDNSRCRLVVAADLHLAGYSRASAYRTHFLPCLRYEAAEAQRAGVPVYSIILGDLTYDQYWFSSNYTLTRFMADQVSWHYPMPMYAVMGNHDNDASIAESATVDHDASWLWREEVAPRYYAFNVAGVHVIVLDDIVYKNTDNPDEQPYPEGITGSRDYIECIDSTQLQWLQRDLAMCPDTTTVLVCLHAPVWRMSSKFKPYAGLQNGQSPILSQMFDRYRRVHFLTGHMHYNVNTVPSNFPNISEHNISSVCGTWWWTSYYNAGRQLCRDGSPAGYSLWEIDGDSLRWRFCSLETPGKWRDQMRIYDMNTVKLYYDTCAIMREVLDYRSGHDDYAQADSNMVMVNVYAYSSGWRLDMLEGDDTPLSWKRVYTQDPLHVIAFEIPHYRRLHNYTATAATRPSRHTFMAQATTAHLPVTVRVVDNFGRVYIDRIERPLPFEVWVDRNQRRPALGDINVDGVVDIVDLNIMINIILGTEPCSELMSWLGDFNVDGNIDSADLNAMVDIILGKQTA